MEDSASYRENGGLADNGLPGASIDDPTIGGGNAGPPVATSAAGEPPLPPESETSFEFELPHAGERYVYVVNPDSDSVAVIDANTLGIQAVEAGDQPTFLQTLAGRDAAVVLNVRSSDATVIRTEGGVSSTVTLPVQSGANAIAVAPDGKHAVVYFNSDYQGAGASGSFQDISVLFLEEGEEHAEAMTVGFRPTSVAFSADGQRGFVVTEDGVSLLDFQAIADQGAAIAQTIPLGDDANVSLDVSVTPDGKYALARRDAESQLRLVDLDTGELRLLDLAKVLTASDITAFNGGGQNLVADGGLADAAVPALVDAALTTPLEDAGITPDTLVDAAVPTPDGMGSDAGTVVDAAPPASSSAQPPPIGAAPITDVDVAPAGDYALAVVRDLGLVVKVAIPGSFTGEEPVRATRVGSEVVGSVAIAPDGETAVLYTNASTSIERVTLFDVEADEYRTVRLAKAVDSVTIAPDSRTALVVHQKLEGNPSEAGITPDQAIDRAYGYSVLDLESGFTKLQTTETRVGPSTITPDGSSLFVLFNDSNLHVQEVQQVNLASFIVSHRLLGSPPTSVGALPGSKKVFVGQDHPDGRISFIDWATGELESVTGFELNSRIRE